MILEGIKNSGLIGLKLYHYFFQVYHFITIRFASTDKVIKRQFKRAFGKDLDLVNPKTLNEKMQWLKIHEHDPFSTICADKYAVREFIKNEFGEEYLIPLLYETTNWRDIKQENIPNCNCILKANHDSGHYLIIRDKDSIDYRILRENCRDWLSTNYYYYSREWQYKNIKPRRIIIEKLLETKDGKIPNDYKLHFINGEFQFIYVSYDREGVNDRCIYDINWNRLPFVWVESYKYNERMNTTDVPRPATFDMMLEFGTRIAQRFKYVRVDFYDVDGKLYFGEITLHHGGGFDSFIPEEYDRIYGEKLVLF